MGGGVVGQKFQAGHALGERGRKSSRHLEPVRAVLVCVKGHKAHLAAFCLGGGAARDFNRSKENVKIIKELQTFTPPSFPLTGDDLLALGIKPGKNMGILLSKLKEKWLISNFSLSKRELLVNLEKTLYLGKGR